MLKRYWLICLLLLSIGASAQVGTWRNLPTLTEIRSLIPMGNEVLLASNGGLLSFDKSSSTFNTGVQDMQVSNFDINTVYIDTDSVLWVGARSPGPILEVIDLNAGKKLAVEFVELDEITSFVQVGDSVYASYRDGLEGGLLLYRKGSSKIEYLDQFSNFENASSLELSTATDVLFIDNKIIFRTNQYILWAAVNGTNLKDPESWQITKIPSEVSQITRMIASGDGPLLAADNKIYTFAYPQFLELYTAGGTILDLQEDDSIADQLVFATSSGLHSYNKTSSEYMKLFTTSGIANLTVAQNEVWVGSSVDFLAVWNGQTYETFSANRPRDHFFNQMILNKSGQLVGGARNGISIYSEQGWRTIKPGSVTSSFNQDLYNWNEMICDTLEYDGRAVVEDIIRDHSGNIFFSLQGKGVLKLDEFQSENSEFYNTVNDVLEPTYNSGTFILPGQMAVDGQNNVWLTNKFILDSQSAMTVLDADSGFYHVNHGQSGMNSRTVKSIAIDQNDFVWVGSQVWSDLQAIGGIHFINHNGSLGPNMELEVTFLSGSPLADNEILQLEVDAQNNLWILTTSGVQSMPLPDEWLNSTELKNWANLYMTPKESDYYYYWQLTDYNVTGIEIDQRGNRWFLSSNAGLHVLQSNGQWINDGYGYNTANSGLLNDEIYSVAFDSESGETYISTPKGISILNTPFAAAKEDYSDIHIYPQPFNPDIHEKVVIQGLMDNSSVKILSISGMLVRELTSSDNEVQGYEAHWDGLDARGGTVGSGVYLLYIYNEDGVASSQKLAIIR